jgi:hypothetical protein
MRVQEEVESPYENVGEDCPILHFEDRSRKRFRERGVRP